MWREFGEYQLHSTVAQMKDSTVAFAYLQPSNYTPFLAERVRSTSTSVQLHQQRHRDTNTAAAATAAHSRNHDWQLRQQCGHRRPRPRHRPACFSLGATIAEGGAAPRLGKRGTGRADEDGGNWGQMRFAAMMQLRTQVAAKVDVSRVMQKLRDEGAEFNLRTYRGCLAFLAKGGRGQEALMYLQEMEVRWAGM